MEDKSLENVENTGKIEDYIVSYLQDEILNTNKKGLQVMNMYRHEDHDQLKSGGRLRLSPDSRVKQFFGKQKPAANRGGISIDLWVLSQDDYGRPGLSQQGEPTLVCLPWGFVCLVLDLVGSLQKRNSRKADRSTRMVASVLPSRVHLVLSNAGMDWSGS